jgi:hypothetical protein
MTKTYENFCTPGFRSSRRPRRRYWARSPWWWGRRGGGEAASAEEVLRVAAEEARAGLRPRETARRTASRWRAGAWPRCMTFWCAGPRISRCFSRDVGVLWNFCFSDTHFCIFHDDPRRDGGRRAAVLSRGVWPW